jgi:DNA polymerase IIIc chi subunit
MEDQDTKIPLAAAIRTKTQEYINTFDDRLYTRLRNEMVEAIENEANKGNSVIQVTHQLKNKQMNRNVLNQLKSSFTDAGYLVTYSEDLVLMDEQIKGRFSISWA